LGLIPARSGSKGIPSKNTIPLAGKPLLAHTIEQAKASSYIDRIIASTDSREIADVAESFGCEVPFLRPPEISSDDTPGIEVALHALRELERTERDRPDILAYLQPTSPLRKSEHIDRSIEHLVQLKAESVVSVVIPKNHPNWMFREEGGWLKPFSRELLATRQSLPTVYAPNGAIYTAWSHAIEKQRTFFCNRLGWILMEEEESVDIDDYYDLFAAEMIVQHWEEWRKQKKSAGYLP